MSNVPQVMWRDDMTDLVPWAGGGLVSAPTRPAVGRSRRRRLHCRSAVHSSENHAAGRRLQDAGDRDGNFLADVLPTLLDHDHRAVVEIADSLADLIARLDDPHWHRFAG